MKRRTLLIFLALIVLSVLAGLRFETLNSSDAGAISSAAAVQRGQRRERCATRHPDETTAIQYEESLKRFNARRSQGQIRRSGAVTVPVVFHVVSKGTGIENGDVPTKWLRDQIKVLNAAYAGADPLATDTSASRLSVST